MKECDGTVADYWRHRRKSEVPCQPSKNAWAARQRDVRTKERKGSKG